MLGLDLTKNRRGSRLLRFRVWKGVGGLSRGGGRRRCGSEQNQCPQGQQSCRCVVETFAAVA